MPKFNLGQVVVTRGINTDMESGNLKFQDIATLISRHSSGDWGDMDEGDKEMNDLALQSGEDRIFSSYILNDTRIWVITEPDRSYTTVLYPSEY